MVYLITVVTLALAHHSEVVGVDAHLVLILRLRLKRKVALKWEFIKGH